MSTFNVTVYVCVVLVIAGNVSSYVINRNRRDLDSTIRELYGPPIEARRIRQSPPSTSNYDIIHFRDEEDHPPPPPPPIGPPVKIDPNVLVSLFGYKPGSKPDHKSIPRGPSTIEDKRRKEEEDILKIFGMPTTTSTSIPELLTDSENSTSNNVTGSFVTDNRFLPEEMLRNQFNDNGNHPEPSQSRPIRPDAKTFNFGPGPFSPDSGRSSSVPGLFAHNFGPFKPDTGTVRPNFGPFWPDGPLGSVIGSETPELRPSLKDTEVYENNLGHSRSLGPSVSLTKDEESDYLRDSTETPTAVSEENGSSTDLPVNKPLTLLDPVTVSTITESKSSISDSKPIQASTKNSSNGLFISKYLIYATVILKLINHRAS